MTSEILSFTRKRNIICFFLHLIGSLSYCLCNDSVFSSSVSSFTSHTPPEFTKPEYSCMTSVQSYVRGKSLESTGPAIQIIKALSTLLNKIVLEKNPQNCSIYIYSLILNFAAGIRVHSSNNSHI